MFLLSELPDTLSSFRFASLMITGLGYLIPFLFDNLKLMQSSMIHNCTFCLGLVLGFCSLLC